MRYVSIWVCALFLTVGFARARITNPARAKTVGTHNLLVDFQNGDGWSNVVRIGLDCFLNELLRHDREIAFVPIFVRDHIVINRLSSLVGATNCVRCALTILRFPSVFGNAAVTRGTKSANEECQPPVVDPNKKDVQEISSDFIRVHFRVSIEKLEHPTDWFGRDIEECVGPLVQVSRLLAGLFSEARNVERGHVGRSIETAVSLERKTTIRRFKDFAFMRSVVSFAAYTRDNQTIGGNNEAMMLIVDERNDNGGKRRSARNCYKDPEYVRRNDESWVLFGRHVENITDHDIDVSYDGKKWFHLFGDYCLKNEEPFANEVKRQCGF